MVGRSTTRAARPTRGAPVRRAPDDRPPPAAGSVRGAPRSAPGAGASAAASDWLRSNGGPTRTNLEQLVAKLSGELEIHGQRGFLHLLLEHRFQLPDIHHRIAARGLGHAFLLPFSASVGNARGEAH